MKSLMIALALAFTAQANARSIIRYVGAELTTIHLAQGSHLASMDIRSGKIALDNLSSEVTLTLNPEFSCPSDQFCPMIALAPVEVTLPVISREVDSCGNVHYTAKKDQRPVDGMNQMIVVSDNRANRCLTIVELPPTSVSFLQQGYDRFGQREFRFDHTFTAEPLQAQ